MAATKTPKAKTTTKTAAAKAAPAKRKTSPKAKPKAATKAKATPARKRAVKAAPRTSAPASSTFDVTKLMDHPLVADLLTVAAMAAVAAIADHNVKTRTGEEEKGSTKAVKAAGKAAAAAIGKRLLTEAEAIRSASTKGSKPGSK